MSSVRRKEDTSPAMPGSTPTRLGTTPSMPGSAPTMTGTTLTMLGSTPNLLGSTHTVLGSEAGGGGMHALPSKGGATHHRRCTAQSHCSGLPM
mmetsp:Transcript_141004/g.245749  ORF Transcript_141004/g.245749 Transcript_141004/m.245749 type:complete len:93 (+) Transcript_141004:387-665(+)